jgi:uncharacterized protein
MGLVVGHAETPHSGPLVSGVAQATLAVAAGLIIGSVAAVMGIAGGELLIPTLVLLFGLDLKLAGSVSLAARLTDDAR